MIRVTVIGTGVIGASAAYFRATLGADVTLVSSGPLASATSLVSFGWLNANGKAPEHYFQLNWDAMREHAQLAASVPSAPWWHGGGSLEWADGDEPQARLLDRAATYRARGYPAEVVGQDRIRALEPDVAAGPAAPESAVHFAEEGWADPVQLAAALVRGAVERGARLRSGDAVSAFEADGPDGAAATVVTQSGGRWRADVVVNAAGPNAGSIAGLAGLELESGGSLGLTIVSAPAPVSLGRVVRAPRTHFRPDGAGRVMLASPRADSLLHQPDLDIAEVAWSVMQEAAAYLPGLQGVEVEAARVGRRAMPSDGLPVVGPLPEAGWLYHAVTHSGVTLAPLLGRLVATEIVNGQSQPALAPYRPTRFSFQPNRPGGA